MSPFIRWFIMEKTLNEITKSRVLSLAKIEISTYEIDGKNINDEYTLDQCQEIEQLYFQNFPLIGDFNRYNYIKKLEAFYNKLINDETMHYHSRFVESERVNNFIIKLATFKEISINELDEIRAII